VCPRGVTIYWQRILTALRDVDLVVFPLESKDFIDCHTNFGQNKDPRSGACGDLQLRFTQYHELENSGDRSEFYQSVAKATTEFYATW